MDTSHFILQHLAFLQNFIQKLKNKVNSWCGDWNTAAGGECAFPVFGVWYKARLSVYCWGKAKETLFSQYSPSQSAR